MAKFRRNGSVIIRELTLDERQLIYQYLADRIREHQNAAYTAGVKQRIAPECDPEGREAKWNLAAIAVLEHAASYLHPTVFDGSGGRGVHD